MNLPPIKCIAEEKLTLKLGIQYKLPMADSIILATGMAHEATVWTQNADFEGLPFVKYVEKMKF